MHLSILMLSRFQTGIIAWRRRAAETPSQSNDDLPEDNHARETDGLEPISPGLAVWEVLKTFFTSMIPPMGENVAA